MNEEQIHQELADLIADGRIKDGGLTQAGGILYGIIITATGTPVTVKYENGQLYTDNEPVTQLKDAPALAAEDRGE